MNKQQKLSVDETVDAVMTVLANSMPTYMTRMDELMAGCLKQMHLVAKGIRECCTAIEVRLDELEARVSRLERGFE
jgi:hypothetical protein